MCDEVSISDAGLCAADHEHTRSAAKLVILEVGRNTTILIVPSLSAQVANYFSIML